MTNRLAYHRLLHALVLVAPLLLLAGVLLTPSLAFARAHKPSCHGATAHAEAREARSCPTHSHKPKGATKGEGGKGKHGKHLVKKASPDPSSPATQPATCEDGSSPVPGPAGSFSCRDGSEPECEDGAAPVAARSATTLVCPATGEEGPESEEGECEEGLGLACGADTEDLGSSEHACLASPGPAASFACES